MKAYKVTIRFKIMGGESSRLTHTDGGDLFILLAKAYLRSEAGRYASMKRVPNAEDIMTSFKEFLGEKGSTHTSTQDHSDVTTIVEQ